MWEYKTVVIKADISFWGGNFDGNEITDSLNSYGKDGWELINVVAPTRGYGASTFLVAFFKRSK